MDPPERAWLEVILRDHCRGLLERNFRLHSDDIIGFAEDMIQGESYGTDTAESMALLIGRLVCDIYDEDFGPILEDNVEGREGKALARGYLGAEAMENVC